MPKIVRMAWLIAKRPVAIHMFNENIKSIQAIMSAGIVQPAEMTAGK